MRKIFLLPFLLLVTTTKTCIAQEQKPNLFNKITNNLSNLDTKIVEKINKKYQNTEDRITKQTSKWLLKTQKQEEKLKRKLAKTDSLKAEQIFGDIKARYQKLQNQLTKSTPAIKQYIPALDSLNTLTKFLQQNQNALNISNAKTLPLVNELNTSIVVVQQKMQSATNIKKALQERKNQLKQSLQNTVVAQKLQGFNKQVVYYNQQLNEYKQLLNNPDKLTQKALGLFKDNASFKDFFNKNSYLAQLFKIPQNNVSGGTASIGGLQTRASVMQLLQQRIGSSISNPNLNSDPQQILRDKLNAAKSELDKLKNKLHGSGGDNVNDADMPNFQPNSQKTKSFLKRLQYGFNIQSQKSSYWLPTTSDIAASVGYKLNDKATIGLGLAYKLGWGNGWQNIQLTNQGVGFRSYFDIKFPQSKNEKSVWNYFTKNLWLSGGYEQNYLPELKEKLESLNNTTVKVNSWGKGWQESGLIGISKKISVGKKKTVKMQFLWDFLSKQQEPHTEGIKFRLGYEF